MTQATQAGQTPEPLTIPGKWLVVGMLLFGLLGAGIMWTYWRVNLARFFPLQKALSEAFPRSSPRVDAGRHKQSASLLRIAINVNYPLEGNEEQAFLTMEQIADIARRHHDLAPYEILEIYLVTPAPESMPARFRGVFAMDKVIAGKLELKKIGRLQTLASGASTPRPEAAPPPPLEPTIPEPQGASR